MRTARCYSEDGCVINEPEHGRTSLGERAYDHVLSEILRGELPVGSIVGEGAVAEELGISKTPVRQALQSLRREGLLEIGARRQLIVRGFSAEHRREVVDVRVALESLSVRRACESMTIEQIDQLRLLLIQQKRAVDAGNEDSFIELDEQFHLQIAAAAGLPIVERFLNQLRGFVRVMRLGTTRPSGHLQEVYAEHAKIADMLEARRPVAAEKALREHLEHADY
jgi:GntR family transcriptional regulator, rspAB operon transcriptional repressor